MNSRKIWSILLLLAMSFSLVHDYTLNILHDEQCSAHEYVGELLSPHAHEDVSDTHSQYHAVYIFPVKLLLSFKIIREEVVFAQKQLFISRNHFNFFKPPIS